MVALESGRFESVLANHHKSYLCCHESVFQNTLYIYFDIRKNQNCSAGELNTHQLFHFNQDIFWVQRPDWMLHTGSDGDS